MSKLAGNDAFVADAQINPADFTEGASLARERAIAWYDSLVIAKQANVDDVRSLKELRAGRDKQQRSWVCFGD